jgi:hypothetical protein
MDVPALRKENAVQNINVRRYKSPTGGSLGSVEAEDGSWMVFIDTEGAPTLFRRREHKVEDGREVSHFVCDVDPRDLPEGLLESL